MLDTDPRLVGHPTDGAARGGHLGHEVLHAAVPERRGHVGLQLQGEQVAGIARGAVQLHPCRQEGLVGLADHATVGIGEIGPRQSHEAQRLHVAHAARGFLQIGLELEGDRSVLELPPAGVAHQSGQPLAGPAGPLLPGAAGKTLRQGRVAGDVARREQRRGGVEILGGQLQCLGHGAHGVAQLQALVPDRIPQPAGHVGDIGAALVEKQQVQVALGAELGPSVATDGHQRDPVPGTAGVAEHVRQPLVHPPAVGTAEDGPHQGAIGDDPPTVEDA